jgi:hypothetical protein
MESLQLTDLLVTPRQAPIERMDLGFSPGID